jgi:hypothetical protein
MYQTQRGPLRKGERKLKKKKKKEEERKYFLKICKMELEDEM